MYCEDMMLGLLDGLEQCSYGSEERCRFEEAVRELACSSMNRLDDRNLDEAAEQEAVEREADLRAAAEAFFAERAAEEEAYRMSA